MLFARGTRLGPYQLVDEIGAGGMGHVFRALDTRLDRNVAVKVLPQSRWSDPEFRSRFEREARAISSLSHPNICALFDVGSVPAEGGTAPYLVMELLEGATLRDHLERGRLAPRRALTWAAQVATGLAAAHEKGLIHRDLKPENIFVTRDELVKILDFGVAKASNAGFSDSAAPARTELRTSPGFIVGTAHYMSPEQIRGETLDARSDIFSLGVVLYEMLAGSTPFDARSHVETMHAILADEAPELGPEVPEVAADIVRRCLDKEPARRFATARDLAFALETASKGLVVTPTPKARRATRPVEARTSRGTRLAILGLILAGLVVTGALTRGAFDSEPAEPPLLRTLTSSGRDSAPAASKDGKLIAFVSARDGRSRIWLKQLADGTEVAVTSGPADTAPRFSPDSAQILFTRAEGGRNAIYRVAVVGGEPRKMLDDALDGDWSPDGKELAFIRSRMEKERMSILCVARADGAGVRELASSATEDLIAPRWSPDGRWLAVTRAQHGTFGGSVLLLHLSSGNRRVLARKEPHGLVSGVAWSGVETIVYAQLDAITGSPRRGGMSIVRHDVTDNTSRVVLRSPHGAADTVDVVGNGRLVFSEDMTRQNLQEVSVGGAGGEARWLSHGMSMDRQPTYARGGRAVVFASDRGGSVDIWELVLESGALRRLTDHDALDWDPFVTSDGATLYWSSNRGGPFEVWHATTDGTNPQQATSDGVDAENPSLPASGDWIYYDSSNPASDGLWRVRRTGGAAERVIGAETAHPEVSADGEYVVYQHFEPGGTAAVNVVRVRDRAVFTLAAGLTSGLARARWIGTTHTIAFRAADAEGRVGIFAQDFEAGRDTLASRRPLLVDHANPETFAISPDGTRVVRSVIDDASGIMLAEGVQW